jgi:hypothetical protein
MDADSAGLAVSDFIGVDGVQDRASGEEFAENACSIVMPISIAFFSCIL